MTLGKCGHEALPRMGFKIMFRVYIRFLMIVFFLAFALMAANPSSHSSFLFFISMGCLLSASMLIYGIYAYKERRYFELFRPIIKSGAESKKPSIAIAVFAIALLAFLYNSYSRVVFYYRMQELLLEVKERQENRAEPNDPVICQEFTPPTPAQSTPSISSTSPNAPPPPPHPPNVPPPCPAERYGTDNHNGR